jgi:hypothetical protein
VRKALITFAVGLTVLAVAPAAGSAAPGDAAAQQELSGGKPVSLALSGGQLYAAHVYMTPSSADAATVRGYDRAADGTLTQRSGAGSCFAATDRPATGCTAIANWKYGFGGTQALAASPDGTSLYVGAVEITGGTVISSEVLHLTRGGAGALAYTAGDCVGDNGCGTALRGPQEPGALVVSADGKQVYMRGYQGVDVFDRAANGTLTQKAGAAGCLTANAAGTCTADTTLVSSSTRIALSPDQKYLYVPVPDGVAILSRNLVTGDLTQVGKATAGTAAAANTAVAVAPDGASAYVAGADRLTSFTRDPSTGALTATGCVGSDTGCVAPRPRSGSFTDVAVAPDGTVIATVQSGAADGSVMLLTRGANGALTQRPGTNGCLAPDPACAPLPGLGSQQQAPSRLAVDPSSGTLYASAAFLLRGEIATLRLPPTCTPSAVSVPFGSPTSVPLACTGLAGGGPVTYAATTGPAAGALGAFDASAATVPYAPAAGFSGADAFAFSASVAGATSLPATVSVSVGANPGGGASGAGGPSAAPPPPKPGPAPAATDRTKPVLSKVAWTRTRLTATLSETARITITVSRVGAGRKRGKTCIAAHGTVPRSKRCDRLAKVATLTLSGRKGANQLTFTGRVKGRKLTAGRYRASFVARDPAGNTSTARIASLTVKAAKKKA